MDKSYDDQVREQIEQYRDTETMHDLPPAFHLWSGDHVAPGLRSVFGVGDVVQFYAAAFEAAADGAAINGAGETGAGETGAGETGAGETGAGETGAGEHGAGLRFLSLGCGDGAVEIGVAQALIAGGITRFRFVCADLSEILLGRFRAAIPAGMERLFELVAGDLNGTAFDTPFDGIMANHSLHHILDLEGVYAMAWGTLAAHGVFATADMIGRNGHMRWPEARAFVDFVWPFLTQRQRGNVLLRRHEDRFVDHDCSGEGFEGIRAQEVLPLLLAQGFRPWKFLGFGGMIDVFVDRCFGPHFDVTDADDAFLIRRIGWLNDVLLDTGVVQPTMMFGWFTKQDRPAVQFRGRSAAAAVRGAADPAWLAGALADMARHPDQPGYVFRPAPAPPGVEATVLAPLVAGLRHAQTEAAALRDQVQALQQSTSWRVTAPLRGIGRLFRR